jgi:hypothetical protein
MNEKIIGYILLVIGIITILSSALSVYQVFAKKGQPIQLFSFPSISVDATDLLGGDLPPAQRELAQKQLGQAKIDILPADILNKTSNIIAHLLVMGFIVNVGFKLASLGVMMIRPIKVQLNEQKNG